MEKPARSNSTVQLTNTFPPRTPTPFHIIPSSATNGVARPPPTLPHTSSSSAASSSTPQSPPHFSTQSSNSSQTLTVSNPIHTHRGPPNSVQCSRRRRDPIGFLSISLKEDRVSARPDSSIGDCVGKGVNAAAEGGSYVEGKGAEVVGAGKGGAVNSAKHLCAGAAAAMVARTFVAPLERLKLEYIIRGEKRNILELIKAIATIEGLGGFWKGNFLNILRTAPFKAINFCAYDIYRRQLRKFSANEETSNSQKFIAGAAAGITATILCLPLDTVRTSIVATGGEKGVGVFSAFGNIIQNEGFLSLYKGLLPSIISIAPSSAFFCGVYDILKLSFLRSVVLDCSLLFMICLIKQHS
ncbi:putative mitochondrial adenine nucleotide transporter BTL3 [Drosera capensis]